MIQVGLKWALKGAITTEKEIAIVVDILRASTTITTLLWYGAKYVISTAEVKEAFELAKKYNALLMGERDCLKIDGFHFGNSPVEISEKEVKNKKFIFTSTSFPKAIEAAKKSPLILVGSMLNVNAVTQFARKLSKGKGYNICFMLAGALDNSAKEELAFVGVAGEILSIYSISNDVKDAINLVAKEGVKNVIKESFHAKRLINLGFKNDIEFACKKDIFNIVPIAKNNKIQIFKK